MKVLQYTLLLEVGFIYATPHSFAGNSSSQNMAVLEQKANQGNVEAQFVLAGIYFKGNGIPQDYIKAFEWYQKAADQGHAQAQNNLG